MDCRDYNKEKLIVQMYLNEGVLLMINNVNTVGSNYTPRAIVNKGVSHTKEQASAEPQDKVSWGRHFSSGSMSRKSIQKIKMGILGTLGAIGGSIGGAIAGGAGGAIAAITLGVTGALTGAVIGGIIGARSEEGFGGLAAAMGGAVIGGVAGGIAGVATGLAAGAAAPIVGGITGAVGGAAAGSFLAMGK